MDPKKDQQLAYRKRKIECYYYYLSFGRSHILFLSIAAVSGACDWCGRDTCQRHPLRDLAETEPHVPQTDGKIPPEDLKKWVLNLLMILYLQRKLYMDNFSHIIMVTRGNYPIWKETDIGDTSIFHGSPIQLTCQPIQLTCPAAMARTSPVEPQQ